MSYAKREATGDDEQHGQGLGFVDVYDTSGTLLGRVAQHGQLNAPWGLAWAPASFGRFGGDLLVGNFGDGQINAYAELSNGHFEHRGELRSADGRSLTIDGLWALEFGNGGAARPHRRPVLHLPAGGRIARPLRLDHPWRLGRRGRRVDRRAARPGSAQLCERRDEASRCRCVGPPAVPLPLSSPPSRRTPAYLGNRAVDQAAARLPLPPETSFVGHVECPAPRQYLRRERSLRRKKGEDTASPQVAEDHAPPPAMRSLPFARRSAEG